MAIFVWEGTSAAGKTIKGEMEAATSQQVWVYAQTGTTPNCFAEASFQVTAST